MSIVMITICKVAFHSTSLFRAVLSSSSKKKLGKYSHKLMDETIDHRLFTKTFHAMLKLRCALDKSKSNNIFENTSSCRLENLFVAINLGILSV